MSKEYFPPAPEAGKEGYKEGVWDLKTIPHARLKSEWARRSSLNRTNFSGGHEFEEGGGNSKLTAAQVKRARKERELGATISSLARKHKIHYTTMYRVIRGETWKGGKDK